MITSAENKFFVLLLVAILTIATSENSDGENAIRLSDPKDEEILTKIEDISEAIDDGRIGPFRNIFEGIYNNYKSTYLGNQTAFEYLNTNQKSVVTENPSENKKSKKSSKSKKLKRREKKRKKKKKKLRNRRITYDSNGSLKYDIGPDVNATLDLGRELVSLTFDENYIKDLLTGNWKEVDEDGRRKKDKGGMMKLLPLFILPFLIQSSIIPFFVAKLKLLLIKSIVVGKLAIFLLVISAIKNSQKINSYEMPTYYAAPEHPSRRSESIVGYKVDGRPTAWVN